MGQPNWSSRNRPNRPHIATVFTVHRTRHLGVNIDTVARTPGVPTRSTSLPLSNRIRPLARETRAWCPLRSTPLRPGSTHPHTALGSKQHEPPPYPSPARSVLALTTPRDRESYAIRFNTPASSLLAAVSASTLCIFDLFHSTMGVGRELWVPLKSDSIPAVVIRGYTLPSFGRRSAWNEVVDSRSLVQHIKGASQVTQSRRNDLKMSPQSIPNLVDHALHRQLDAVVDMAAHASAP